MKRQWWSLPSRIPLPFMLLETGLLVDFEVVAPNLCFLVYHLRIIQIHYQRSLEILVTGF